MGFKDWHTKKMGIPYKTKSQFFLSFSSKIEGMAHKNKKLLGLVFFCVFA